MATHREILVPTDFSAESDKALDEAVRIAERDRAEIVLLHLNKPLIQCVEHYCIDEADWQSLNARIRESAEQQLAEQIRRAGEGREVTIVPAIREGPALGAILREQRERKADLIVIAEDAQRSFPGYLFESIPGKVARKAECTVLLVR